MISHQPKLEVIYEVVITLREHCMYVMKPYPNSGRGDDVVQINETG